MAFRIFYVGFATPQTRPSANDRRYSYKGLAVPGTSGQNTAVRCTISKRNGPRWCRPEAAPDQEKRVTVVSAFTPVNKAATPHE